MDEDTDDEADANADLPPLSLRQKFGNKRFNKSVDRVSNAVTAVALGIVGYGAVKPTIDYFDSGQLAIAVVLVNAAVGIAVLAAITYVSFTLTRRED